MPRYAFGTKAAERKGPTYTTGTRQLQVAEDIVPIAQLKANLSEVVRGLAERPRPLVITLNGSAAAVLMSPQEYDRLAYRARLIEGVDEGLADAKAGHTISDEELGRRMDARYRVGTARRAQR